MNQLGYFDFISAFKNRTAYPIVGSGTYNINYRIKAAGRDFLMRVPRRQVNYDLRTLREVFSLKHIKKNNFSAGPNIIFASKDPYFLVLDFIHTDRTSRKLDVDETFEMLNCLHRSVPIPSLLKTRKTHLYTRIRNFSEAQMLIYADRLEKYAPGLTYVLQKEVKNLPAPSVWIRRFLHGDPSGSNFLYGVGGCLRIIDFELAAIGDPQYDFALLLNRTFASEAGPLDRILKAQRRFGGSKAAQDLLCYALMDTARAIHVACAKYLDPESICYDAERGEARLTELLKHRNLLAEALAIEQV